MKWHQKIVWKKAELCSSATFLSLTSQQPNVFFPCS